MRYMMYQEGCRSCMKRQEVYLPCKTCTASRKVYTVGAQESPLISRFGRENRRARRRLHNDLGRSCGSRHGTRVAEKLPEAPEMSSLSCQRVSFSRRLASRFGMIKMPRPRFRNHFGFTKAFWKEKERKSVVNRFFFLSFLSRDIFTNKVHTYRYFFFPFYVKIIFTEQITNSFILLFLSR